jgi:hypothetical protein
MKIWVLPDGRWSFDWEVPPEWASLNHSVVDLNDAATKWLSKLETKAGLEALNEAERRMSYV